MPTSTAAWAATVACLAAVILAVAACGSSSRVRTGSGDVTVYTGTPADLAALPVAFSQGEDFPPSGPHACPTMVVPGSTKFARVQSTGTSWAIARITPSPECHPTAYNGQPLPPSKMPAFGDDLQPLSVFELQPGGSWVLNGEASDPWPCPVPAGRGYGGGISAVPRPVLVAWNIPYARGCQNATYPELGPH